MSARFVFNRDGFNRLPSEFEKRLQEKAQAIQSAKGHWLRKAMFHALPPHVFNLADSKKVKDRRRLQHYLRTNKIRLEEHPNFSRLMRDEQIIGEFRVITQEGKVTVEAKVLPEPDKEA